MSSTLRMYIRSLIHEMSDKHKITKQDKNESLMDEDEDLDEDDMFDESIGAGAIQGVVGYLGASSQDLEGPATRGERKKRKTPGWT